MQRGLFAMLNIVCAHDITYVATSPTESNRIESTFWSHMTRFGLSLSAYFAISHSILLLDPLEGLSVQLSCV